MQYKFKKLMIIDDDEIDNYLTKTLINNNNIAAEVLEFYNGYDAYEYLYNHKDDKDKIPDLILLDIYMPKMDGIELLVKLSSIESKAFESCKICVVSSTVDDDAILQSKLNNRVKYYTKKPITLEFLNSI